MLTRAGRSHVADPRAGEQREGASFLALPVQNVHVLTRAGRSHVANPWAGEQREGFTRGVPPRLYSCTSSTEARNGFIYEGLVSLQGGHNANEKAVKRCKRLNKHVSCANPGTRHKKTEKNLNKRRGGQWRGRGSEAFFLNPENKTFQTTWRGVAFRQVRSS
jgi:hypothetical protein